MATTDAGSRSSHRCQVTTGSSSTLTISTKTYGEIHDTGLMVIGACVRKLRYGTPDHFWMFSSFSSLLIFYSLDLSPVQMTSALVFSTLQRRWSFAVHRIRRKIAVDVYQLVVALIVSYDCICWMIVFECVSLTPLLFACTVYAAVRGSPLIAVMIHV
jgi:hypothetical protein